MLATWGVKCLLLWCRRFWGDFGLLFNTANYNQIESLGAPSFPMSLYRAAHSDVTTLLTER